MALAWLLLMVLAPDAYFYMLVAQARFNLFPLRALKLLCELPMTLPLFVVAFAFAGLCQELERDGASVENMERTLAAMRGMLPRMAQEAQRI